MHNSYYDKYAVKLKMLDMPGFVHWRLQGLGPSPHLHWSKDGKTIGRPLMAMVPWKKKHYHPIVMKNYHRWRRVKNFCRNQLRHSLVFHQPLQSYNYWQQFSANVDLIWQCSQCSPHLALAEELVEDCNRWVQGELLLPVNLQKMEGSGVVHCCTQSLCW